MTQKERHQLLVEWNNTFAEYPQDKCIHQLFEEQVERSPSSIAVVFEGKQLTYQELNAKANQLAHYLRSAKLSRSESLGVKPEVLIGICVERSLDTIVGILGILKAGAAYVPLDPAYPQERIAYILEDAQISVLLTQQHLLAQLPKHQAKVICLDTEWNSVAQESQENLATEVRSNNLAYVIYTSGSTGKPKGVQIQHGAVVNFLSSMRQTPGIKERDILLSVTTITFDIAALEIYLPLIVGARVVVAIREVANDGIQLLAKITDSGATMMQATPATWRMLLEAGLPKMPLKILCGGEALSQNLSQQLLNRCDSLWNLYGPTETTIWSAVYEVNREDGVAYIGSAIANTQIYILDKYLNPVPIGIPGELYIAGDGLARGYINRPDLTAERFIPNPFSSNPGARLYKTGDLARYLADGNIEFIDRVDYQVKIRGFRIELGEIENFISQHPAVKETVVIAITNNIGDKQLVAYIVPRTELAPSINSLRNFLKQKLPNYMIPATFIMLETLPLTPNGKIDKKALPKLETAHQQLTTTFVPPQTSNQKILANIWAEVLQLKQVGIHDNFFELGGDSILSLQIIARCHQAHLHLTPKDLFQYQTIAELAQIVTTNTEIKAEQGLITGSVPLHCLSSEAYGYIPTDFPNADLTQAELDELVESLTHKVQIESIYPLSSMQEGMLFHTLYAPNSGVYFEQFVLTLNGKLNISTFEQAWQRVVELHPVLRTFFIWKNRQHPLQVACKSVNLPWHIYDWRFLQETEQKNHLKTFLQTERENGFQLDKVPLMRCTLIQLADDRYEFVWSYHHLLIDGWCLPMVLKQVWLFYQAFNQGEDLYLDAPPPYQNYIAWLQQQDLKAAENFWRKTLEGFTKPTPLVVDKLVKNLPDRKDVYAEQYIKLSALLTEAMKSLAQQHHLTLNTLVQGAWALLLSRYSGESDVVFGATVSGRPPALLGVESMVGLFINTLPVRVKISPETELLFWLKQLQRQQIEREQYSYSSLVDIQGWSNVPRDLALFNSIVVFENYPINSFLLEGKDSIEICGVRGFERTNYPLTVSVVPEQELSIQITYDTNRFDDDTISRILRHFQTLLEGITANPKRAISTLSLLTLAERQTLLIEWNQTSQEYPRDRCIHHLFETQAKQTPDAIALVFEDEFLTYQALNSKANQLAHYLQKNAIQPQQLIGICLERSLDLVISVLATLKAGCAYVPLDPDYPKQRLTYTIENASVSVVLTQNSLSSIFSNCKSTIICLDIDEPLLSNQEQYNPTISIKPDDLAYIIYTSGSTGDPKGVAIAHSSLVSIYFAWQEAYQLKRKAYNILQMASFSFDVFVGDLVRALCSGGKLVLCSKSSLMEPEKLYQLVQKEEITFAEFVPSVLIYLTNYLEKTNKKLDIIELLIVGSDRFYVKDYQHIKQFCQPQTRLINSYGVTEATIDSCYFETTEINLSETQLVPIGRPYKNSQVYILDSYLQPVPIGVPGELYIAGEGLARGYFNRFDLTQEKFILNLFSDRQNSRFYKTGDLARYLPDGNIEFLGRLDDRLKLRGFRIELGEIESVLSLHPEVKQAVVLLEEDSQNDKLLVAYLIPKDRSVSVKAIRHFLQEKLPGYMIPSTFVLLEAFPLTPNGKIDRKALLTTEKKQSSERKPIAPRDYIEQRMVQIWSEILNVYPVGVQDNFFELGGHSLLAIRLMAQIQQQFQQNFPLAILFEAPTVEELANLVRSSKVSISWSSLVPIQPRGTKPPLFFVPGSGGNVIYLHQLANALGFDRPFYGLQAQGLDGKSKILTTIEEIAAQYVEEIITVQPEGSYYIGGHSFGGLVAFEIAQQLIRKGHKISLLAILDTYAPLAELKFQPWIVHLSDLEWLVKMVGLVEELVAQTLEIDWEAMASLTWDEQLNHVKDRLVEVNFLPPSIETIQLCRLVEVFKTQYLIEYVPQNVYPIPIALFVTQEFTGEEFIPCEVLHDPTLGWQKLASSVEVYTVPGTHTTMIEQPHVEILVQKLIPYLSAE